MTSTTSDTPPPVSEATARFRDQRAELAEAALAGADSLEIAARLAEVTDAFILAVWQAATTPAVHQHSALLALGSYGRGELSFGSDIDLMIELGEADLFGAEELHDGVERFMTWCRDAKLKLGHSVRTPDKTRQEFEVDPRTPVSLLDARALGEADAVGWETVRADEAAAFLRGDDDGIGFVQMLMQGYEARLERNGKTVYLLEPDIKAGEGGLRDLNCIHWAGQVRWGFEPGDEVRPQVGWLADFRDKYRDGLRWIMRLRHLLHLTHGREHDRLTFPDQEKIAAAVLQTDDDATADPSGLAEALMRRHYREARAISMLTQRLLRRWQDGGGGRAVDVGETFSLSNGQLTLRDHWSDAIPGVDAGRDALQVRTLPPTEVVEALRLASAHDALLGPMLEMSIAQSVATWGDEQRADAALNAEFRRLLTDPRTSPKTSERLLENGLLTHLVPEFEPIVCHVQHDVYHVYTTDVHSLKCLEKARSLVAGAPDKESLRWRQFAAIAAEIERTEVFLLAALFHDIGKNRGGDHSRRGAEMMNDIGQRLGLGSGDVDQLAFLVREHLTLSDTARRRDLSDPRVVRELAGRVRTVETLNELTALTFCDMSTVGPNVMTDWNATLITELYHRLRQALENGLESLWRDRQAIVEQHRQALWELLQSKLHGPTMTLGELRSQLDTFVRDVPTDHFASTAPEALLRQFETYRRAGMSEQAAVSFTPLLERGVTEIIVCAKDVPGTLAKIAGVISASGLNIMAAQIVTTAGGRTLDIFQASQSAPRGSLLAQRETRPPVDPRRLERLEDKLVAVLDGEVSVESMLKKRISEARLAPRPTPPVKTLVDARQDVSDAFTVIEVRAPDRMGLLYEIARTLYEHGASTHVSKVDSLGTQIIDTFYVEEVDGGKLCDARIGEVINALVDALRNSALEEEA